VRDRGYEEEESERACSDVLLERHRCRGVGDVDLGGRGVRVGVANGGEARGWANGLSGGGAGKWCGKWRGGKWKVGDF
jgi:hypothetical protein